MNKNTGNIEGKTLTWTTNTDKGLKVTVIQKKKKLGELQRGIARDKGLAELNN